MPGLTEALIPILAVAALCLAFLVYSPRHDVPDRQRPPTLQLGADWRQLIPDLVWERFDRREQVLQRVTGSPTRLSDDPIYMPDEYR